MGKVLTFIVGSRDTDAPPLLQIANVGSGEIRSIHGEEVTDIVDYIGQQLKSLLLSTIKYQQQQ